MPWVLLQAQPQPLSWATQGGQRGKQRGAPAPGRCKAWRTHLPTTISSCSVALLRKRCHTSMANRVLLLLKMEVRELMRAAMITAIIRPRRPGKRRRVLWLIRCANLRSLEGSLFCKHPHRVQEEDKEIL